MPLDWKKLTSWKTQAFDPEKVAVRDRPYEELGFTLLFVLFAGLWSVFSDDVLDKLVGRPLDTPALQTLKGINFIMTTALLLYVVLRRGYGSRRKAQEASRLTQERFESAALATNDAIWDWNLENNLLWWSDGVQKLFGYSHDEVSPRIEWWTERLHPEDRDRVVGAIRQVIDSGGRFWSGHYRFRRRDGSYGVVMDRGYILLDAHGKPVRMVGGMTDITERRRAEEALESSRRQLRGLTARLQSAREEERTTVAREIHDELGQALTAVKINLDWLERRLGEGAPNPSQNPLLERVVECAELTDNAITTVQRIASDLRPGLLDNLGLTTAIEEEVRGFQQRMGIPCDLDLPVAPLDLGRPAATAVFRILQESLTNVARHAGASRVKIRLQTNANEARLDVEDNGRSIPAKALADTRSLGLLGMRERAAVLGGEVSISPLQPAGTRVSLRLPHPTDDTQFWAAL